jgi:phosphoenolpyruvate carboxylase
MLKIALFSAVNQASCMSLQRENMTSSVLKRLVERATNRQPLTVGTVNGAGGSVGGLENISESGRIPYINTLNNSSSSSSLSSSTAASTVHVADEHESQGTVIPYNKLEDPKRKNTIQSFLAAASASTSCESTVTDDLYTLSGRQQTADVKPYARKRSCSMSELNPRRFHNFLRANNNRFHLLDKEPQKRVLVNKPREVQRKNAIALPQHRAEELDALVQLHCHPNECVKFSNSRRRMMIQAWEEQFERKKQQQFKNENSTAMRKRSISIANGINQLELERLAR